jgi:hypothetical protein
MLNDVQRVIDGVESRIGVTISEEVAFEALVEAGASLGSEASSAVVEAAVQLIVSRRAAAAGPERTGTEAAAMGLKRNGGLGLTRPDAQQVPARTTFPGRPGVATVAQAGS